MQEALADTGTLMLAADSERKSIGGGNNGAPQLWRDSQ